MRCLSLFLVLVTSSAIHAQSEEDYYKLSSVDIPEAIKLEIGGMDFLPDGRLAVCTRRGEVYLIDNWAGEEKSYQLFARGLHEPLGLAAHDGAIYVSQRGEVTKMEDTDGDDWADRFETVYELPLTGNYHEYHYGPLFQPDGSFLTTLNVGWEGMGVSKARWRGWMLQYDEQGRELSPYAAGMRSPAGFGTNAAGDVFVAENQGDWIGSGRITHLAKGDFAGHPASLGWSDDPSSPVELTEAAITDSFQTMYRASQEVQGIKLPAVWFPHGILGISTAAIITDRTGGAFGPFADQLFVSDQGQSKIMRVSLEKVNGEYQGAVFPFREGFSSGLLRLRFDSQDRLVAGQTARGWAATGGEEFALEHLSWTGEVPFEMYAIEAGVDGLDIVFTEQVDPATIRPDNFTVQNFTYLYRQQYGSPAVDIQDNPVTGVRLMADGKTVHLTLDGYRPGYIYEVKLGGIRSGVGAALLHDFGYYTLNTIPGNQGAAAGAGSGNDGNLLADESSAKRPTAMPADWGGEADVAILLETKKGMRFAQEMLSVKAGQKVQLTFRNPDDMQHNFVLTDGRKGDRVGQAAAKLGLKGLSMAYVPEMDAVLYHTKLVEPETDDTIYFRAPEERGLYEYVCTVPGHYTVMRGVLRVM